MKAEQQEKQPVIALIRVSTAEQAEDDRSGIARQEFAIRRICDERDLNLIDTIKIDDVSGTETHRCPEVLAMLARLRFGEIKGIVVADFDRLMRPDEFSHLALLDIFVQTKTILHVSQMAIDLSTAWGKDMIYTMARDASRELTFFKYRVSTGKEAQRMRGRCPNSHITLPLGVGYNRKLDQWFYKDGIERVQEAFRLLDESACDSVAAASKKVGMTPRGLGLLLRNKIYLGVREYTMKRGDKYPTKDGRQAGRKKVRRTAKEIICVKVIEKPAVDPKRFDRVQELLDAGNRKWRAGRISSVPRLGSSLLTCSRCGRNLNCKSGTKSKRGYYVCASNDCYWRSKGCSCEQPNIPEDEMDKMLVSFVADKISDPSFLKALVNHHLEAKRSLVQTISITHDADQRTIKRLKDRLARMEELYLDGGYDTVQDYKSKRKQTEAELHTLEVRVSPKKVPEPEAFEPMIRRLIQGALAIKRTSDRTLQQKVLRSVMSGITIRDRQIVGFGLKPQFDVLYPEKDTRTDRGSSPPPA